MMFFSLDCGGFVELHPWTEVDATVSSVRDFFLSRLVSLANCQSQIIRILWASSEMGEKVKNIIKSLAVGNEFSLSQLLH